MKEIIILFDDIPCLLVALINNPLHLSVNGIRHTVAIGLGVGQVTSDEYLILIPAVLDHAHLIGDTVLPWQSGWPA